MTLIMTPVKGGIAKHAGNHGYYIVPCTTGTSRYHAFFEVDGDSDPSVLLRGIR